MPFLERCQTVVGKRQREVIYAGADVAVAFGPGILVLPEPLGVVGELARNWAAECGGLAVFDTYPSIMLAVEDAHSSGSNPRQALEQKIASLRERCDRLSS